MRGAAAEGARLEPRIAKRPRREVQDRRDGEIIAKTNVSSYHSKNTNNKNNKQWQCEATCDGQQGACP